jgi:hypothetical protein
MAIVEQHRSPDGLMMLLDDLTASDWTIGFDAYDWHTHGDILQAWGYDGTPEACARAFVDDILKSRRVIAVVRTDGKVSDIIVPDDHVDRPLSKSFAKYAPPNETTEFRYWNGQSAAG